MSSLVFLTSLVISSWSADVAKAFLELAQTFAEILGEVRQIFSPNITRTITRIHTQSMPCGIQIAIIFCAYSVILFSLKILCEAHQKQHNK